MVGLIDLPLELREPILLEVVTDTIQQQPATTPELAGLSDEYQSLESSDARVTYFCKSLKRHAMPLLHINQQIRAEVIDIVFRKLGQRIDDAKLDVIYEDSSVGTCALWASWLSAPFPARHLHTLHTQIRYFNIAEVPFWRFHSTLSCMEDCKHWIARRSAEILLKFVVKSLSGRSGNASIHESQRIAAAQRRPQAHRTVQKLVINIPIDQDTNCSREALVRCMLCTQDIHQVSNGSVRCMVPSGKRAGLVFASSLCVQFLGIFDTEINAWRNKRFITKLFECVGTIELNVGGRLFRSFNLSQILAKLPRDELYFGVGSPRAKFFEWKRAAEDKRKAAGFESVSPSLQEHELAGSAGLIASILAARDKSLVHEVIIPSDEDAPSPRQSRRHQENFVGNALFIQEDGSTVAGKATFCYSAVFIWFDLNYCQYRWPRTYSPDRSPPQPDPFLPGSYSRGEGFDKQSLEVQPRKGEVVLFQGEAIIFSKNRGVGSITSGDATFYTQAEEARPEQPGSFKE